MARRALKLSTPKEVRQSVCKIVNELRSGDLTPQQASAMITGCNTILQSIRTDEQQRRIDELGAIVGLLEERKR